MNKFAFIVSLAMVAGGAGFAVVPVETENELSKKTDQTSVKSFVQEQGKPNAPLPVGHPLFSSPHANPIAILDDKVFVVNTPADTVDVIDVAKKEILHRIAVGIDPVCVVARPDGKEIWVSNHVSDSVSVIDTDGNSPTYLQIIATIQDFDPETKATRFDEPVGIAFANNDKAYVALSSENNIAIVDAKTHKITGRLNIPAQDPRAIRVKGDRLFVIPFESNNKTQLSGGAKKDIDGELVTFDAWEHSIRVNNVLSIGHVTDIVKHPRVPDRDLFVFDTKTDKLVTSVDTLGTLLYGMAVDSRGRVFIAQTDARNDVNGKAGTKKHSLKELENRAFLNRVTKVDFGKDSDRRACFFELEPLPPRQPESGMALATPYAIEVSRDDSLLVATAAGSDKMFTIDPESGDVLGRVSVGAVPRGIALEHGRDGQATQAWVYNAVANTVSCVDLSKTDTPKVVGFVKLDDPTHPQVKSGRTLFNDASASTSGTFSCASCHPDGHTDQLLWVLKTPVVTGARQIMPRSTMPIRGLRDTAPFHWDGIPGDPYGGNNSANVHGSSPPNSRVDDPESTTRHLIDGGLATTMHLDGDESINDEGKTGKLSAAERDDMAKFLLSLPYPPAQRRAYDNVVSKRGSEGFRLFHVAGDNDPTKDRPNVCGNCHRMPFLVSTNTPGTGMDAPTWRGAYDRFLILPQGRLNIIDFPFYRSVAERGQSEEEIWRFSWGGRGRFNPVWNMVVEGSTGFSGSFARQVTLNKKTVDDQLTADLLDALETSAKEHAVVLEMDGVIIDRGSSTSLTLQFDPGYQGGSYVSKSGKRETFSRNQLEELAAQGRLAGTFTGRHGDKADIETPQPAIWTLGPIHEQRGRQRFPILFKKQKTLVVSGRHFDEQAGVFVDGRKAKATVSVSRDQQEQVAIQLDKLPEPGMHLVQVQAKDGFFSNDFIFHVAADEESARDLQQTLDLPHNGPRDALRRAIAVGDMESIRKRFDKVRQLDTQRGRSGATLLNTAALYGRLDVAKYLIERGAKVDAENRDGNTALHTAAFLCRKELVSLLLENRASTSVKNGRGETPVQVVSGDWNNGLARFYSGLATAVGIKLDLERIRKQRPEMVKLLKEYQTKPEISGGR